MSLNDLITDLSLAVAVTEDGGRITVSTNTGDGNARLIPLSQVDQYLGLAGRIRNGG